VLVEQTNRSASKVAPEDHIVRFDFTARVGTDRMTYLPELLKALSQVLKRRLSNS
jgi:hypothetical protein